MNAVAQYLYNLAHLFDQALNTLLGGDPRQTLSARMGRDISAGRCRACRFVCHVLDFFETDHCAKAWADEQTPFSPTLQTTGD